MPEFDEGFYWVQMSVDQEAEVARFADGYWIVLGYPGALDASELYRIGKKIEIPAGAFGDPEGDWIERVFRQGL
jgi:hypothetical protein